MKLIILVIVNRNKIYDEFLNLWNETINYIKIKKYSIKIYFLFGKDQKIKNLNITKDNIFISSENDSIKKGVIIKTFEAFDYIEKNYDYEYILRTNISSFFIIDKLLKLINKIPSSNIYGGISGNFKFKDRKIKYCSGTCILLSKDVVSYINNNKSDKFYFWDDVLIGEILRKHQILILNRCDISHKVDINEKINEIVNDNHFHVRLKSENRNNDTKNMKILAKKFNRI